MLHNPGVEVVKQDMVAVQKALTSDPAAPAGALVLNELANAPSLSIVDHMKDAARRGQPRLG
eukprot:12910019-Prorocentrum_lima.AAC.1